MYETRRRTRRARQASFLNAPVYAAADVRLVIRFCSRDL
jgi:hypothetical protein